MKSPTLALLEESDAELTRENFLNLAFFGNPPSLSAEEEADLPVAFQTVYRQLNRRLREKARKMEKL